MSRNVPQGSILNPLMYSIYANDLPLQVNHCQIHMYADDVQLYMGCSASDAPNRIRLINVSNIGFVIAAKSLGVTLNGELNWPDHIKWTVETLLRCFEISGCHSTLHQLILECYWLKHIVTKRPNIA